jgi:hypothetical protein
MEYQRRLLSRAVQVAPLSVEVKIFPKNAAAASLLPSAEEVIALQFWLIAPAVQVSPLSMEV